MSERSVYLRLMAEMYLRGIDSRMLAEKTGIHYGTLRRKFRGQSPLLLDEALKNGGKDNVKIRNNPSVNAKKTKDPSITDIIMHSGLLSKMFIIHLFYRIHFSTNIPLA